MSAPPSVSATRSVSATPSPRAPLATPVARRCERAASTDNLLAFVDRATGLLAGGRVLHRSTDGGATWARAHAFGGEVVDIAPAGCATVFVLRREAGGTVLERSDDAGRTWRGVAPAPKLVGIAFVTPDVGYGLDGEGRPTHAGGVAGTVWKTTDGGRNWTALRRSGDITGVAASPGGVVLAANHRQVFRSTDGGTTFSVALTDTAEEKLGGSVGFVGAEAWALFAGESVSQRQFYTYHRSRDGGRTWQLLAEGLTEGAERETPVAFDSYAGSFAGSGRSIVVTGSEPARLEASAHFSTDGGRTFRRSVVRRDTGWSAHWVAVLDARTALVAGPDGERPVLYRTTDAGRTWREVRLG